MHKQTVRTSTDMDITSKQYRQNCLKPECSQTADTPAKSERMLKTSPIFSVVYLSAVVNWTNIRKKVQNPQILAVADLHETLSKSVTLYSQLYNCLYSVNTMSESKQVFSTQSELLHDNPTTMSWEILMTIKPSSPAFTWNSKTAGLVPLQVRGPSYSNKMLTLDIHL